MVNSIKKRRTEKGLSQEDLALLIGVDVSTVCLWESGKRNPKYPSLKKLSEVFECTIDEVIADEQ